MITKIQDPSYLNQVAQTYKGVLNIVNKLKPQSGAWVSKSGGALHGGAKDLSPTFADGFWYLDQLGMASTYNHKVFCRQTLIGGNYALLNTTTSIPNPDTTGPYLHTYSCTSMEPTYGSLVLAVTQESNPNLRVYAHCAKKKPGISIIFLNLSKDSSFNVTLPNYEHQSRNSRSTDVAKPEFRGSKDREEYHLAALAGNIQGQIVLLNDVPMVPTETFDIPTMEPKLVNASTPISIAAHSIVYVTIRDFQAPARA
ncbi:heparanase-like protein 1 [Gossypium arboreum]|uniref:heparanase-like protein 1 n=1 Tax=Gossypium arboreum TaxID=29729 RepID=UPI0022F1A87B|nr:heparanase-like protein 1 [Gossypium arboreum]